MSPAAIPAFVALLLLAGCSSPAPSPAPAAQAPPATARADRVLIVVNDASSLSETIGEYYARRRGIPARNVCRIRTSEDEEIPRAAYDREIATPVAACLRGENLTEKVLYIVTTGGVPLRVAGSGGPDGDIAAVDSELTLLYADLKSGRPHPIKGIQANPFYGQRDARFSHPQFPIYLVARLAAYSFSTVRNMIDRSLEARNRGVFVVDKRSDGDEPGEDWLRTAAIRLPESRVRFDETGTVLSGEKDVIAYASWGSNDRNRKHRRLDFGWLPGSIATEYVSTNGRTFARPPDGWELSDWGSPEKWFAGAPQTLTADYLEEGASAATGHVAEPYLAATPHPDLLLPAYYSGRSLAESFYLSIPYLSWQNIVVGDPLMTLGRPE